MSNESLTELIDTLRASALKECESVSFSYIVSFDYFSIKMRFWI